MTNPSPLREALHELERAAVHHHANKVEGLGVVSHRRLIEAREAVIATLSSAAPVAPEPIAEVGSAYTLLWAGSEPLSKLLARHPGVKVGSKLYATPQPPLVVPREREALPPLPKAHFTLAGYANDIPGYDASDMRAYAALCLMQRDQA